MQTLNENRGLTPLPCTPQSIKLFPPFLLFTHPFPYTLQPDKHVTIHPSSPNPPRQTLLKPHLSQPDKRRLPPWQSHEDPLADGTRTKSMAQIILLGDQEKMDGYDDGFILLTQQTQQAAIESLYSAIYMKLISSLKDM
ncbi:hypothetical protein Tco_0804180 [Tanacetum coccineum]|uniref:Uncharacterized protein n=1 Tax=Tanacetum coccineum TaxID=301880 RepID=A0ABQ5A7S1_9ASTR